MLIFAAHWACRPTTTGPAHHKGRARRSATLSAATVFAESRGKVTLTVRTLPCHR